jgi:hypothetical protein
MRFHEYLIIMHLLYDNFSYGFHVYEVLMLSLSVMQAY